MLSRTGPYISIYAVHKKGPHKSACNKKGYLEKGMADCGIALYSNCNREIDRTSEPNLKQNTILSYKLYYVEKLRQQTIAEPFKNVVYEEGNTNSC